jgi:GDP-mannose 6-dehydrogenase
MRVSVFGLGYVGCVTAACLAKAGHQVVGVDVNEEKLDALRRGRSPIVEPGLDELLEQVTGAGHLRATGSTDEAVHASELALLCVGTPSRPNGQLDGEAVARVASAIGAALRRRADPFTVVLRSTVLPGTAEDVLIPHLLAGMGPRNGGLVHVAVNPEFMREGSSLADFARPPMTLVGAASQPPVEQLRALYDGVDAPFVHTDVRSAEMAKYVANAFHALKVCFANEIGDLCAAMGADQHEVMRVFLTDKKLSVSEAYLRPGFAFGGSCLPKDVRALLHRARALDLLPPLLGAILPSNEAQIRRGVEAVLATRQKRVGVVGLAFKDGTDDLRESPMVALVEALIGKGCAVRVFDRNVSLARLVGTNRSYIEEQIPHIASLMCDSLEQLLGHAEVLVLGNAGSDAVLARAGLRSGQAVVDLTRGGVRRPPKSHAA